MKTPPIQNWPARCLALLALLLTCHLTRAAETVIWQENFDDGLGDNPWFADGTGAWQMGSPTVGPQTNVFGKRAFSGTNCATVGLNGN